MTAQTTTERSNRFQPLLARCFLCYQKALYKQCSLGLSPVEICAALSALCPRLLFFLRFLLVRARAWWRFPASQAESFTLLSAIGIVFILSGLTRDESVISRRGSGKESFCRAHSSEWPRQTPFGDKQSFFKVKRLGHPSFLYTGAKQHLLELGDDEAGAGMCGLESHRRHAQGFSLACLLLQVKIYYRCAD